MSSLSGAQYEAELPAGSETLSSEAQIANPRDAELFRRAQSGDRGAFGQIVLLFQDRLYNAILRMVGDPDEARELTQETFTRALVKIESFRGESGPYTWLFRIAVNLSISQLQLKCKLPSHIFARCWRQGAARRRGRPKPVAGGSNGRSAHNRTGRGSRAEGAQLDRPGRAGKARRGVSRGPSDARHRRIRLSTDGPRSEPAAGNAQEQTVPGEAGVEG